jgi:hypothetical protein
MRTALHPWPLGGLLDWREVDVGSGVQALQDSINRIGELGEEGS